MLAFLKSVWFRLTSRIDRDNLDRDLAEELRTHREFLEDEARRSGATSDEVRQRASLRLGNTTVIRERSRDAWSWGWLEMIAQDVRYAGRFLRRSPGFTAVAVGSLALGIGANAAVFTVVDRLLLRPPAHVQDPGAWQAVNVRRINQPGQERPYRNVVTFPEIFALQESATSLADMVYYTPPALRRLGRGPDAPRIKDSMVSGNFFSAFGVRPILGRFFDGADLLPDASDRAAVISHGFWKRQFGRREDAVGARLTLSGVEFTVIGVAPEGFGGMELDAADTWTPLDAAGPERFGPEWKTWDGYVPRLVVRLRDGVPPSTASAEATVILRRLPERPNSGTPEETVQLGPVLAARGPAEQSAEVKVSTRLALASGLVLLAACANLANLLLVRALTRRREIALRLAVGISRRRLVGQLAIEALLISLAGAGAALLAARWGGGVLRAMVFPQLQWASGTLDWRVAIFSVACAVTVALVATIAPAIRMTRADVAKALRSASPHLTMSTGRLRQGLLALQVALSVLLIVGAAAFGQSLRRAYEFDMGVDLDRVILTRLFPEGDSLTGGGRREMLEEAARRARQLPGVERVTFAARVPLAGNAVSRAWVASGDSAFVVNWDVTPELVQTIGFRLVRGRWIQPDDTRGESGVALVTETMARHFWPTGDAVGACVRFDSATTPCRTVVGVVRDLRQYSLREEAPLAALLSTDEPDLSSPLSGYLVIRTNERTPPTTARLHELFRDVRPDLATVEIRPLVEALERDYRPLRLGSAMFGSFAVLAVILAGVGLFGILAFSVAQRTSELGIRSALGASGGNLVRHVMGEGLVVVGVGLAIGGALSWFASTVIETLLFNTTARSGLPFAAAAVVLGLVGIVASAVPAWRAARVDPAIALRAE
jgi:predicted permease